MAHAEIVRAAVLDQGRVDGDLLRVDHFLNHRIDLGIVDHAGAALAESFAGRQIDLVVTAEASGIAPALACARALDVPVVFAKKFLGPGNRHAIGRDVTSPTKGTEYRVEIGRRVLDPGLEVLVVDDFLSRGRTAEALGEIVEEAGGSLVGLGFVIEKTWMGGRERLEARSWEVDSVVRVASLAGGVELE